MELSILGNKCANLCVFIYLFFYTDVSVVVTPTNLYFLMSAAAVQSEQTPGMLRKTFQRVEGTKFWKTFRGLRSSARVTQRLPRSLALRREARASPLAPPFLNPAALVKLDYWMRTEVCLWAPASISDSGRHWNQSVRISLSLPSVFQ